jgi:hypothetical protein
VDDAHGGKATGTATINILPPAPTDPLFDDQWYLKAANILPVWDDYTGKGVKIGILDDGITAHPDLNFDPSVNLTKIGYTTGAKAFLNNGDAGTPNNPSDDNTGESGTHGTFLAGLIAGKRNDIGVTGVAYGSGIQAYISYGDKTFAQQEEVDVSSNSWMFTAGSAGTMYAGSQVDTSVNIELKKAAEQGRHGLGTVIAISAGNSRTAHENTNYFEVTNSRYAITVGGVDSLGKFLPFSTPGANILVVVNDNSKVVELRKVA